MEVIFLTLLFLLALPGLPISLPLMIYFIVKNRPAKSEIIADAIVFGGLVGLASWIFIGSFFAGMALFGR